MATDELGRAKAQPLVDVARGVRPTRVRYRVLAAASALAIVTYILRVGFAAASKNLEGPLGLNERHLGYLMAAFLISYGLFEIPWGLIGDRLGVRTMLAVVALGGSITTAGVALAALLPVDSVGPLAVLIVLRALFGMFQAGTFPGLSRMMADWMPVGERGSAQGVIWMSSRLGGTLAPLILGGIAAAIGVATMTWSTPLVLAAGLGLAWCVGFWVWFRDRPEAMPSVNAAELAVIASRRSSAGGTGRAHGPVPWSTMLGSGNAWALCLMYGFLGCSGNFFLTMLPTYLRKHRGLSDVTTDWLTSVPFACGVAACLLGGLVSDAITRRYGGRRGRRIVGAAGMALAASAFLATIGVRDVGVLAALLGVTFFANDLAMAPAWAAASDIGERYAGTLGGAMNMMANLMGAGGALMAGTLFEAGYTRLPFVLFSASYLLGALCWLRVDASRTLAPPTGSGT